MLRPLLRRVLRPVLPYVGRFLPKQAPPARPFISHPERVRGLEHGPSIDPTARLFVRAQSAASSGYISLGKGAYLGRHVELAAPDAGCIVIGDDTSIQDFCVIHGDVAIGAHCLFAMHIMVSSTAHRFRDRPEWLIRDQDEHLHRDPKAVLEKWSRPIVIEDDCWLGWSAAVMPGVYIGRGAVIGANCVVTSDIGPYEVHGGVPNQRIASRLAFSPPPALAAADDAALPYFYKGFETSQKQLAHSRRIGIIMAHQRAAIVLSATGGPVLRLTGMRADGEGDLSVRLSVNGADCGIHDLKPGPFEIMVDMPTRQTGPLSLGPVPEPLQKYTYVALECSPAVESGQAADPRYGVSAASLL